MEWIDDRYGDDEEDFLIHDDDDNDDDDYGYDDDGEENLFKQVSTGNLPSFLSRSFGGFVLYTTHWKEHFDEIVWLLTESFSLWKTFTCGRK